MFFSFGIILWELLARDEVPYPTLNIRSIAKAVMDNDARPGLHDDWPNDIVNLIIQCWHKGIPKNTATTTTTTTNH